MEFSSSFETISYAVLQWATSGGGQGLYISKRKLKDNKEGNTANINAKNYKHLK
jgi:hypothetical protein